MRKRRPLWLFTLCLGLLLTGCAEKAETLQDKIPMVRVEGKLYYDTGEESPAASRSDTPDGEITASVEGTEIPTEDDQSNFGTGYPYQFGDGDTIEVQLNGRWMVFEQREGTGSQVRFGDRMVDASGLSEETLEWLDWYNNLPAEEQLKVSAIPSDLLTEAGIVETEDAEAPATSD